MEDIDYTPRRLLSITETRSRLGDVGRSFIYGLIARGELVKVKLGRRAVITESSVNRYIERITAAEREGTDTA